MPMYCNGAAIRNGSLNIQAPEPWSFLLKHVRHQSIISYYIAIWENQSAVTLSCSKNINEIKCLRTQYNVKFFMSLDILELCMHTACNGMCVYISESKLQVI